MNEETLTTRSLFELETFGADLPAPLKAYLENTRFPWEALGKPLTAFVSDWVASIPASERLMGQVSPAAHLENPESIYIGEGAVVEAGAFVSGPTWIAPGAVVRHGAYVRGSVVVCAKAVVGHTTEVKGSILLPEAKAAHFAYVGDSLLGRDCNLGAGTKLANLRMDHGLIKVRCGGGVSLDTGLKKMGAILGNGSQTGCNSVTNPGCVLLKKAFVLPCKSATGVVGKEPV